MLSHTHLVAAVAFAFAVAACSSSSGDGGGGKGGSTDDDGGGDAASGAVNTIDAGDGKVAIACYQPSQFGCTQVVMASAGAAATYADTCSKGGGVPGAPCPVEGLLGCCSNSASGGPLGHYCYYEGGSETAAYAQGQCASGNGTWTTTP